MSSLFRSIAPILSLFEIVSSMWQFYVVGDAQHAIYSVVWAVLVMLSAIYFEGGEL